MKQLTVILSTALLWVSCQPQGNDLDAKKAELETLKKEISNLQTEAKKLESEISELDTGKVLSGIAVRVDTIVGGAFKNPFQVQGVVSADDNVNLSAEIGGNITRILISEGQKVSKGQLLVTIDGSAVRTQIAELEKALELATITFQRQKALWDQKVGTELQYLQSKNNMESLEKRLESTEVQLSKFNIRSPVNGSIDAVFQNAGDFAAPGMPILRVVGGHSIKVEADISEKYLRFVKEGNEVKVHYPALNSGSTEYISAVGDYVNPNNRTFKAYIQPRTLTEDLKPNLLAIITAYDFTAEDVLTVPTKLVRNDGKSDYVMLARKGDNGRFEAVRQNIKLSRSFASKSIVTEGLNRGDLIITEGYQKVIQGDKLDIIP